MRRFSPPGRAAIIIGTLYAAAAIAALIIAATGPFAVDGDGPADLPLYLLMVAHASWAVALFATPRRFDRRRLRRALLAPEVLLAVTAVFFLFNHIYALNANMEYVERFIDDGTLRLALDTATERLNAFIRFLPFFVVNIVCYLFPRVRMRRLLAWSLLEHVPSHSRSYAARRELVFWSLPIAALAAFIQAIAFPSFLVLDGIPVLGWVALVPLFLLISVNPYGRSVFYGTWFGTLLTMQSNFWLATFNLVSLQFTVVLYFAFFLAFMLIAVWIYKRINTLRFLVFPLAWTLFELLRSSGFLGYPWTLLGHSQFSNTALIQVSSLTGVWGITFLIVLANAAIAESLIRYLFARPDSRSVWRPLIAGASVVAVVWIGGAITLFAASRAEPPERTARVALVQQNTDPRQAQYRTTLRILQRLTDEALEEDPDLIAWSETAFVPNIRRWAAEDPPGSLTPVVNEFLDYQEEIGKWLLTGNDDYELIRTLDGREVQRNGYNAAVMFDDTGSRRETYRKIRLVPFTEYFPYRDTLPWVYETLQEFDVYLWEPGRERTVFQHPKFTFSTPICFEDVFPNEVRQFVNAGAEVILNLTNDYWSLTEVQAKQHFAGAIFRAIENRRPMLRSTASGLTSHIDPHGNILGTLPYYEEAWMTADVGLSDNPPTTLYSRLGDWFPVASGVGLLGLVIFGVRREER